MLRKITRLVTMLPVLFLMGCGGIKYTSSYYALMCYHSSLVSSGTISFKEFKGRFVFKLKRTSGNDGPITYEGSIKEGEITVFYDVNDTKYDLFSLSGEETTSGYSETIEKGKYVYIVLESNGKIKEGSFAFNMN